MRNIALPLAMTTLLAACATATGVDGEEPDDAAVRSDACSANVELCNGVDDNCNGQIDEGFRLGESCTVGVGGCQRTGKTICSADGKTVVCDATPGAPAASELCGNGIDDNCNGYVDEGYPNLGATCANGVGACQRGGHFICGPDKLSTQCDAVPGTPTTEICNGIDDDCNPATADGSADPRVLGHSACGVCGLGQVTGCANAALVCADPTNLQTDPNHCGSCTNVCTNGHGSTQCTTGSCNPSCSFGWQDCDGNPSDGCETGRISGSGCGSNGYLGSVSGDGNGDGNRHDRVQTTGMQSFWYRAHISEDEFTLFGSTYLSAIVWLFSPQGVNFDLYVYCYNCGGTLIGSSTQPTNTWDRVDVRHEDNSGDDSFDVLIEVRYAGATSNTGCGAYTLLVDGNYQVNNTTCN